jgi:hypothetical protein
VTARRPLLMFALGFLTLVPIGVVSLLPLLAVVGLCLLSMRAINRRPET